MAVYRFKDRIPKVGKDSFVSESAQVIGDVKIGDNCYIGHGSIIRGDYGTIEIGNGTAIEEGANLHVRPEGLLKFGEKVTVGHGAVIHGKLINSYVVIGIGAIVGFDIIVGTWSIVAEGCVVTKGANIPDNTIVAGVPYKKVSNVKKDNKDFWLYAKQLYINLAMDYLKPGNFERID